MNSPHLKTKIRTHPSPSFKMISLKMTVDPNGMVSYIVNTEWKAMVSESKKFYSLPICHSVPKL